MKTYFILILLLIQGPLLHSQQLQKEEVIGSWTVVRLVFDAEVKNKMDENKILLAQELEQGFVGTIFNFSANNGFNLSTSKKIPIILDLIEQAKTAKWKIINDKTVAIGTAEDKYSLMHLEIKKTDNKVYFLMSEVPFILEVTKKEVL